MLVCCLVHYSTMKMEVTSSSKTSVDLQQTTTWRYIPEGINVHNYCYGKR
jgi:hypothetical protein